MPNASFFNRMRANRLRGAVALMLCLGALGAVAVAKDRRLGTGMVFIMLGPPGSGKSTQSEVLSKKYKIPTVTAASVLKKDLGKKAKTGIQGSVESGELLNRDALQELMKARLLAKDMANGFILSGYPQTAAQAEDLDKFLKDNSFPRPKVIFLDAPDEVVTKRMLARRRADDQPENIERRLKEFHAEVDFLVGWYKPENLLRVDGTKTIPEVSREIEVQIDEVLAKRTLQVRPQQP